MEYMHTNELYAHIHTCMYVHMYTCTKEDMHWYMCVINMGKNNSQHALIKCVWQGLPSHFNRPSLGDCHTLPHFHGWLL